MKLVQAIMTNNPCYKTGRKITVKGLMLHSIGGPQPSAPSIISYWNSGSFSDACVHGFIDGNDGTAYQTLPWDYRGWHAGGSANNIHIGVEMCEPSCIKYTQEASFTCSDVTAAKAVAKRTYDTAVELFAMLCEKYHLDPLADGVIVSHAEGHTRGIASNHADPEHLWRGLGMSYTMNTFRQDVKKKIGIQASSLKDLSETEVVEKMGALFTADQKKSGILASVSFAQFILESGYGKTELAQKANNCFGMKCVLSGNTWSGSAWGGVSKYTKQTKEQTPDGKEYTITADFRKDACVEDSIADHSAYLLGAKNDTKARYAGLKGCTDYKKAIQIIKDGGYATDTQYVPHICSIIERFNLTRFDTEETPVAWYRVRKNWLDSKKQKGAYKILENAKACADANDGYSVFDANGKSVYKGKNTFVPYLVRVTIGDLTIRKESGTNQPETGSYTGKGLFTIVEEADGKGASKWGLLKAYAGNRDGWVSLDFCKKV